MKSNLIGRREMLSLCKNGFGSLALMGMMSTLPMACGRKEIITEADLIPDFKPTAKSIIFLYMDGGISQVDSFDPKPRLALEDGQDPYKKFKVDATQFNNIGTILKSPWDFKQYGESGIWVSELFPNIARCVDEMAMIHSMTSNFPEHTNANYFLHTGSGLQGRPSMGAWMTYGLGSENQNLPGYVVIDGGLIPPGGLDNFKSGFLPATYQASLFRAQDQPIANIKPTEETVDLQEYKLSMAQQFDQSIIGKLGHSSEVESAISNYELAFKMQSSVPELTEFSSESPYTLASYGFNSPDPFTRGYAAQCLLARKLVEKGVRFIELTCPRVGADRWDQHSNLKQGHERNAHAVDQPTAALIMDLKARGLLDNTLVVFSSEFGRTPFAQGRNGRDHNPSAFSMWMAGGGIKGGTIYGETDEYGYRATRNKCSIHDLHATMMHLLGIDHEHLTFRFGGRDLRLTDVHGHVIHDIIA